MGPSLLRSGQSRFEGVLVPDAEKAAVFANLVEMDSLDDKPGNPSWLRLRHFASSLRAPWYRF